MTARASASTRPALAAAGPLAQGAPVEIVARRYRLGAVLGRGEGGTVFAATDALTGQDVALKLSHGRGAGLAHEFLVSRSFEHPNIIDVSAAGPCEDGGEYIAMELLRGAPLSEAPGPLGSAELFEIALGCARALAYVHGRGYIHGDLKPDNIWIAEVDGRPLAKLLDFGLATLGSGEARGTLAYLAPEILAGGVPDARSDLFALGVSLYQAATGANPFAADTRAETIERIRVGAALAPPRGLSPGLQDIIAGLMAREPSLRVGSARELSQALYELPLASSAAATAPTAFALARGPLVGRGAALDAALSLLDGGGDACLIATGPAGLGKTRLVDELIARAGLEGVGALVIGGREGPADPVLTLLHGLSVLFSNAYRAEVAARDELPAWVRSPSPSGRVDTPLSGTALADFVASVLGDERLVVAWDDVDLAEPDHHSQLLALAPVLCRGGRSLLVTWRRPVPRVERALVALPEGCGLVTLAPLSAEATGALLDALLGATHHRAAIHQQFHDASAGNPRELRAALSYQLSLGNLSVSEGRVVARAALRRLSAQELRPPEEAQVDLSALALDTLAFAVALLPEPFDGASVAEATGHQRELDVARGIRALVDRGILSELGEERGWRFTDRRVRGALREQAEGHLSSAALRDVARAILARDPGQVLAAAELLARAGDAEAAGLLATEAGEEAARGGRPGRALSCFLWVIERGLQPEARGALLERAGDAAADLGEHEAARRRYRQALAERGVSVATLTRKLGWSYTLEGRFDEGVAALKRALIAAVDEGGSGAVSEARFALGWTLMMMSRYDEAEEQVAQGLALASADGAALAQLRRLEGTIRWQRGESGEAMESFNQAIAAAEDDRRRDVLADSLMGLGTAHRVAGEFDSASHAYVKAIELNRDLGRPIQLAKCLNCLGVVRYIEGRWDEAASLWEEYRDACIPAGDRTELVLSLNNLGFLYKDRGEYERAVRTFERGLEVARGSGLKRFEAMLVGNFGEALMLAGRLDEARALLEEAVALSESVGASDEALEGRRRLVDLQQRGGAFEEALFFARRLLAQARSSKNVQEEGQLQLLIGVAQFELGAADDARRSLTEAKRLLEKTGERVGALKTQIELARIECGTNPEEAIEVCHAVRREASALGAGALVAAVDETLALAERSNSRPFEEAALSALRLAASFSRILDLDQLLDAITDSAIELADAERGILILFSPSGEPTVHTARERQGGRGCSLDVDAFRVSRTVAERVFRDSVAVAVVDVDEDEELSSQASIRALHLRSILCVPLVVGSQKLGILYVDSREQRARLEEKALTVLEALAAQAASAILNARQFDAEQKKQQLLSTMLHELRSPLGAVQGLLELLVDELPDLDPELAEMIRAAGGQLERLTRLTGESPHLAQILSNTAKPPRVEFSLRELATSIVYSLQVVASARRQRIELRVPEALPAALGSVDAMAHVFSNLISNAINYAPPGGRILVVVEEIAGEREARPAGEGIGWTPNHNGGWRQRLRVSVADSGPGVPQGERASIFEWNTRGAVGRSARRGSGIGLALARTIVHKHGGEIGVGDGPLGGAEFWFTVPGGDAEPRATPEAPPVALTAEGGRDAE